MAHFPEPGSNPPVNLTVVIPIHNEEEILRATADAVVRGLDGMQGVNLHQLILSENGSRDETLRVAFKLASKDSRIKVLSSDVPDYGAAMRAAFIAATGEAIVNFDADYYDFDFVDAALRLDAGIVIAAKNIDGATDARSFARRNISKMFSRLVRSSLGINATETHGIKLYRRNVIDAILPSVLSTKDLFDTELVARAELAGFVVAELPITTLEMRESRSGIVRRIPRTLIGLMQLRRNLRTATVMQMGVAAPNRAAGPTPTSY